MLHSLYVASDDTTAGTRRHLDTLPIPPPPPSSSHLLSGGRLGPRAGHRVATLVREELGKNLAVLAGRIQEVSAAPINLHQTEQQ